MIKATVAGSLMWMETEQRAVDQVAALGLASRRDPDGTAILRMEALNGKAGRQVVLLIARRLVHRFRIERTYAKRVALAVMHEYMRPNCIYCGGKGETHVKNEKVQPCGYCHGSGLHRYSDYERSVLMGAGYNQRVYEDALAYLRDTERELVRRAEKRLGEQDQPNEATPDGATETLQPPGASNAAHLIRKSSQ